MLHDARMAGLAKLRRSIRSTDERQLRAVAANGSKEPVLPDAANAAFCTSYILTTERVDQSCLSREWKLLQRSFRIPDIRKRR
jgi:hypothetical protein